MTHHDLIAAFETLAEAPDGVKRLRELVLQLAVRGKLVPQDAGDEPASILMRRVAAKRIELGGRPSKGGAVPPDEFPYLIPATWAWVRFGDIFECRLGKMLDKAKNRGSLHPYLRNANVRWGSFDLSDVLEMRLEEHEVPDVTVRKGDLVICEGGEPGRSAVWDSDKPFVIQKALHRARPYLVDSRYYQIHLRVDCASGRVAELFTGATIQHLTGQVLDKHTVTVPPLAEQHRIVARVDELMSLLDRLEAARTTRDDVRRAARDAALAALRDAEDTEAVEAAWGRIAGQMDALFAEPEDVAPLRQAVLQLAVRGRLVPQDPNDHEVEKAIGSIKTQRLNAGNLPAERAKDFGTLAPKDWPFVPPPSWRMLLFGDVFIDVFTGPFGTSLKAHEYRLGGTPVVNPQNLRNGVIVPTEETCVGPETLTRLHNFTVSERDIVVARRGEMGRCAVVTSQEVGWLCGTGSLVLRPPKELDSQFVAMFLGSPWTVDRLGGDSVGSTMKNLNQKIMANLPFGLPPLAEQHRIVAKVDALMALCDTFEARLTAARELHAAFAAAAVHHLDV
ncbi:restriction endonuclease subunit S [Myxococcota bacterium]|nr:restriction endonuclease subunit S [Myxococcota bacterium]